jgi:hypothetical protein
MGSGTAAPVAPQLAEHVRRWRLDQLRQAGYPDAEAQQLAERDDVDLHRAVDLLRHGCPLETALRILL